MVLTEEFVAMELGNLAELVIDVADQSAPVRDRDNGMGVERGLILLEQPDVSRVFGGLRGGAKPQLAEFTGQLRGAHFGKVWHSRIIYREREERKLRFF